MKTFVVAAAGAAGSNTETERGAAAAGSATFTRLRRLEAAGTQHVGEHGGAEAPGDDQPVCFDGRMRRGSGEAAPAGGPLAVRDGLELLLPGGEHPGSPSDDVHSQKHSGHAAELPGRHHHVLQAASVGVRLGARRPPPGVHGVLPPGPLLLRRRRRLGLRLLLGVVPAEPPAGLAAAVLAHGPPRAPRAPPLPPAADARVAAGVAGRRLPAAAGGVGAAGPEMRAGRGRGRGRVGVSVDSVSPELFKRAPGEEASVAPSPLSSVRFGRI